MEEGGNLARTIPTSNPGTQTKSREAWVPPRIPVLIKVKIKKKYQKSKSGTPPLFLHLVIVP